MANTIALAQKFQPILDEVYKASSLTARLDAQTKPVEFAGANIVNVFKTSMVGLGDYSRTTGYAKGDVTGSWEQLTLTKSRGREFSIDRMDDEETLAMAFGTLAGEFIRTQVIPEVDAYRFATYAGWTGIQKVATPVALTSGTVLAAIDAATLALDNAEVPAEGRLLFVSSTVASFLKAAVQRYLANQNDVDRRVTALDTMTIINVPQTRFYTQVTLDPGATSGAGGYAKTATTGRDINFLMLHPSAVLQATKHANLKIFDPEVNQTADAYKVQYRLYHDAFVYANKVNGVYLHNNAS